jgi:hypothetical protein
MKKEANVILRFSNMNLYRSMMVEILELSIPNLMRRLLKPEMLMQMRLLNPLSFGIHLKNQRQDIYQI